MIIAAVNVLYTVQLKQCCEIKTWKNSALNRIHISYVHVWSFIIIHTYSLALLKLRFLKYTVTAYFVVFFRYCRCVSIQSIFHRNSHMISLHVKQIKSQVTMGQKISSVYYARLLYGFNVLLANIMYMYSVSSDSRALFAKTEQKAM